MVLEAQTTIKSVTLTDIRALVQNDIEAQNQLIHTALSSNVALIQEIGQHIIHSGGKRIRPLLVLLTSRMLGIDSHQHHTLATIIEFIHTATLLHDDVVDHSLLRRGKVTAHALFGTEAAVLSGDFLYSRAFQLMATLNQLEVMSLLADTTNTIAEGEVMQLQHIKQWDLSESDYRTVIAAKTAVLFSAACELSAVITQQPLYQKALRLFGHHLGIAFQMMDDILDYTADETLLGKKIGDDLAEGKMTLPLIHALNQAPAQEAYSIKTLIQQGLKDQIHLQKIIHFIRTFQGFDYGFIQIQHETQQAYTALQQLPANVYRDALAELIRLLTQRSH